jgi:DNA-binding NtrC family response regulator
MDDTHRYVVTDLAIRRLQQHEWGGNIRELKNLLQRALVLADTPVINAEVIRRCLALDEAAGLPVAVTQLPGDGERVMPDLKTHEHDYLRDLMRYYRGDRDQVARTAGISVRSLYRKLAESD